jgi:DHA1 family bicyclomycin/chloramphenicol resistance-like MFS transporter
MLFAPWPWIFVFLAGFAALVLGLIAWRLPETLHEADRRPIDFGGVFAAARETVSSRVSVGYTLALTLVVGGMFGFINAAQQVFAEVFVQPRLFTLIFALIACGIASASLVNARLVGRLGSRKISHTAMLAFLVVAGLHFGVAASGHDTVWRFAGLQMCMMFCFGLMIGNFGAMAMEPLGHIAGSAASIQGFFSTLCASLIGFAIGQQFNGTVVPLTAGFFSCGLAALVVVVWAEGGRLFGVGEVDLMAVEDIS